MPFTTETSLPRERYERALKEGDVLEFSHTLDDQIGGQIRAGFTITGFFEDGWSEAPLDRWFKTALNTRATRP